MCCYKIVLAFFEPLDPMLLLAGWLILQGSSDTTFYLIAVYFVAVAVKDARYSVGAMLLADLVGIIISIILCYMFFGNSI